MVGEQKEGRANRSEARREERRRWVFFCVHTVACVLVVFVGGGWLVVMVIFLFVRCFVGGPECDGGGVCVCVCVKGKREEGGRGGKGGGVG